MSDDEVCLLEIEDVKLSWDDGVNYVDDVRWWNVKLVDVNFDFVFHS